MDTYCQVSIKLQEQENNNVVKFLSHNENKPQLIQLIF